MSVRAIAIDWSAFPCALGDVVVRSSDSAEAWLAGALVLREDAPAAVLFVAPDAGGDRAIYARPRAALPSLALGWLAQVAAESVGVGVEPPSAIEIGGVRFERRRRLPLRAERVGEGVPDVGVTVILGEYRAASGEVAIVLAGEADPRVWRGVTLEASDYDVWGKA